MRTFTLSLAALATVGTALLAGCSSEPADEPAPAAGTTPPPSASDTASGTASPTPTPPASTPAPAGPRLEVSIRGTKVLPNAQTITVRAGSPLTVSIESDRAGELHVHSKPEQYVEFGKGGSEHRLVIKTPGSVEIEEHDTGAVVALLTVEK